jgi:hypothetical protein
MKEFRNVHSAQHYLQVYIDSGRDINIIRSIPPSEINCFDVWQCVFEEEKEAYRVLSKKEFYYSLRELDQDPERAKLMIVGIRLLQLEEWNTSFTVDDAIQITIDCFGENIVSPLINYVSKLADQRQKIIEAYKEKDEEWVSYAQNVINKLKKYQNNNK